MVCLPTYNQMTVLPNVGLAYEAYFLTTCPSTAKLWLHISYFIMVEPHLKLPISDEGKC